MEDGVAGVNMAAAAKLVVLVQKQEHEFVIARYQKTTDCHVPETACKKPFVTSNHVVSCCNMQLKYT